MTKLKLLLLAGAALALASPAHAALQLAFQNGASTLNCVDGGVCDVAGPPNQVLVFNQQVGSFHVQGTASAATPDSLSQTNLTITNTSATTQTLVFATSQNGFIGPISFVSMAGAGSFENSIGGSGSLSFHADPGNALGAFTATDTPGALLFNPSTTVTTNPQAFSGNDILAAFSAAGPFSMTLDYSITLPGGGSIVGLESSITAVSGVPEMKTWAMAGVGFGLVGLLGLRKRKSSVSIA
jgi:hypothetical protein